MNKDQFLEIVAAMHEGRNLEFKQSTPWDSPEWKAKLIKSVLGFSNVRDGGWIVVGVSQRSDGGFELAGMDSRHLSSYDEDTVSSKVAEYADPYAKFSIEKINVNGKDFVVIRVLEFDEIPVLCKKDFPTVLRKGAMYTRSYRIAETVEVPSQTEMREILELATDKAARKFIGRMYRIGAVSPLSPVPSADKQFDQQLADLK